MTIRTARSTAAGANARNPETPSRLRVELRCLLELFVLCGFVVAQPLFDVAGRSPEFFLYRRAGVTAILPLVALAVLGPPVALWVGEALVGLTGRGLRRAAHLAVVAGLLLLLTIEVAKRLMPVRGVPLLLLGVAGGLAGAAVYTRSTAVRLWLRYATPAPLVFALLFLTVSPVGKLVVAGDQNAGSTPVTASAGVRPPVVVVFLDEFPMRSLLDSRGRIDRRLFPNFARFAGDATWYRNATGVSPFTPDAVPAMLSGRYPSRMNVAPIYTEYPGNLFTLLAGSYEVRASESVTQLCPPRVCAAPAGARRGTGWRALGRDLAGVWIKIVSPRRIDEDPTAQFSEDTVGDRARAAGATPGKLDPRFRFDQLRANQPARFADFLERLEASDQPTLHFLHLLLPHQPFRFLPSGARYTYPPIQFGYDKQKGWTSQPAPLQLALQRHLLQLAYTDRLVGEVVQRLKTQGLYDKALVIITADHGNSFAPGHVQRLLQNGNAHELLWVPLFIKTPHQRTSRVDDRNWEHVDLLPTIADLLQVEVPWRVDGVSAMAPERSRRLKYFYNKPNERLEVDGPRNQSLALQGITDRLARPQHGVEGLFQVGPYADLVGRRPETVGLGGSSGLAARLETHENENLKAVDTTTGTVPALVTGALTGPLPDAPVPLAVAVNGTIGAAGLTFTQDATRQTFAMVVSDRLFQPGANHVRLYRVERVGAGTRLHPVELAD